MTDQLLGLLTTYGMPALFGILMVSSIGAPFPVMFVLIAAGSFVTQGEMKLWEVLTFACAGSLVGDQIGYATGRWGGREMVHRLTIRIGAEDRIRRAEELNHRWGGAAIFFTRWLVTPLGPWLNLTSGFTGYPWARFLFWDALGEALWVLLYVMLGKTFSGQVQGLADLFGNLSWVLVGIIASIILGWKVLRYFRAH